MQIDVSVLEAERAVVESLSDKTRSPHSSRRRPRVIATTLLITAGLGAWAGLQLWPLLQRAIDPPAKRQDAPPPSAAIPAQLPPIDSSHARYGTDSSLSETPLQLVLVATQPGRNAQEGTAAFGPDPRNPQIYAAGAVLENGARLVEIYADRIVLERGGKRAELRLTHGAAAAFVSGADPVTPLAGSANDDLTRVGGERPKVQTRASSEDPLSQVVRAQLAYQDDRFVGFQVFPGTRQAAFRNLGLEPGDVIGFVNGQRITKESSWRAIADALNDRGVADVTVIRGGQMVHLALDGLALEQPQSLPPASMPSG